MKKRILSFVIAVIVCFSLNLLVFAEGKSNNDYDYLLKTGMPQSTLSGLSSSEVSFFAKTLKEQEDVKNKIKFDKIDTKFVSFESSNPSEISVRSIPRSELQLSVYSYFLGNAAQREVVFVKFNWLNATKFMPHVIGNDSLSYSINGNHWDILSRSEACEINYLVDGSYPQTKTLDRPSESTWAGSTYKIPLPLHGNSGVASFSMRQKTKNPSRAILVHYVDDNGPLNNTSYSVSINGVFNIGVSPSKNIRSTSERLSF